MQRAYYAYTSISMVEKEAKGEMRPTSVWNLVLDWRTIKVLARYRDLIFFFTHAQTVIGRKVEARNISSKTYEASKCCSSLKMASDHIKMTEAANSNKIQNQNAPKPHTALQFNSSIMHKMGKYSGSGIWRSIFMEASRKYSQQPFSIESIHY